MNSEKSPEKLVIDWYQVDTVLLDMDGTLLDLHFDNFFWQRYLPAAYASHWGLDRDQAENDLFARFRAVQGTLDWYCLDYWRSELGLDIMVLKREIQHLIAVRPGVWEFLEFLQLHGKRSVLVTNAHPESLALKMGLTGIASWLDRLISAHDFGYPKEDRLFWKELSVKEPFDPARTLFIDDTPRILHTANQFGIRYLWSIQQPDSRAKSSSPRIYPQVCSFSPLVVSIPDDA